MKKLLVFISTSIILTASALAGNVEMWNGIIINNKGLSNFDYLYNVAQGKIPTASYFASIGEREDVAVVVNGSDMWPGTATTTPIPPSGGIQMSIKSSHVMDNQTSIGARSVHVHFLNSTGYEKTETVFLNGTSAVDTASINIRFVNKVHTQTVGSNGVTGGTVKIYKKTDATAIYNLISAGGNMSLTSSRMVPYGKTLYVKRWSVSATNQKRVVVRLRATADAGESVSGIFLFHDTVNLIDSVYVKEYAVPLKIPALSVLKVSAWATLQGAYISTSIDGWIE